MRQADHKEFAEFLNRLREGNHTMDDLNVLKGRLISTDSPDDPHSSTHLMHTSKRVNAYNNEAIQKSRKIQSSP